MPTLTTSSTPWTVRTTKRKSRSSEPQPRKRQCLTFSHEKHTPKTVPQTRQQTLTQIQFTPRLPSPLEYDDMESIEPSAGPKSSRQPRGSRARKGLKKQRSTLTQMDFLARDRFHDEGGVEELGIITPDAGFEQEDMKARKENVNPGTGKKARKPKRRSVGPAEESGMDMKAKRRKTMNCEHTDDRDQYDCTPMRRSQNGVESKALSEHRRDQNAAIFVDEPSARFTRAHLRTRAELLEAKPPRRYIHDEKENLEPTNSPSRLIIPETPKKPANVIPSSQSPESSPSKSRMIPNLCWEQSSVSPLKERPTNIIPTTSLGVMLAKGLGPMRSSLSPKKKICVLKYGPGLLKESSLPEAAHLVADAGHAGPSRVVQSSTAQVENKIISSTKDRRGDDSAFKASGRAAEPEIPETSQMVQPAAIPSSQTDTEEEDEIPETSQGLHRFMSTSSANKSEESLRMLSDRNRTPQTVKATNSIGSLAQLESGFVKADVQEHDLGLGPDVGGNILGEAISTTGQPTMRVLTADQRLPAQLLQKESIASTIQDSENEDDEDEDDPGILLCTRSPIVDNPLPSADLARQSSTSTHLYPPSTDTPSSPTLPPVPLQTSYASANTIRVPTKLPSSSSSAASSPSLLPPPPPQPKFMTQQSIRPASMPRPSQVSTQAATQQSWLHMSSMPFPYTCTTSSPTRYSYNAPEHVTIKDSSSIPIPLQDIASQSGSQSQLQANGYAMVDLGLGLDDGGLDDRDDDLDPKSSQVMRTEEQNQQLEEDQRTAATDDDHHTKEPRPSALAPSVTDADPYPNVQSHRPDDAETPKHPHSPPSPAEHTGSTFHHHHHQQQHPSTDQAAAAGKKTPQPPNQHPLARLHLSESMLESLPGPPGWMPQSPSQRSGGHDDEEADWDDRML